METKGALQEAGVDFAAAHAAQVVARAPSTESSATNLCPSCAGELAGKYCHACGEEGAAGRDLSFKHFAAKLLREITDIEHSKIFRTFSSLLFKPGFLTNEFLAGRRNLYLTPLKICFIVFTLYLFFYSIYKPVALFNVGRIAQADTTGKISREVVNKQAAKKGIAPEAFLEKIDEQWHKYMSLLQITSVLFFALVIQFVYIFSKRYFVEHLVFSMHFLSFAFLFEVLIWPLTLLTGVTPSKTRLLVILPAFLLSGTYLFFALKRVYGQSHAATLLKTIILSIGYRLILLFMVLLTMLLAFIHVLLS